MAAFLTLAISSALFSFSNAFFHGTPTTAPLEPGVPSDSAGGSQGGSSAWYHNLLGWVQPVDGNATAAELSGVTENKAEDLQVFLSGLAFNLSGVAVLVSFFSLARQCYPMVYSDNDRTGASPAPAPAGCLGWVGASWRLPEENLEDYIGLDHAMLLEFSNLCMRIMVRIGALLLLVMAPLNCFIDEMSAGEDYLSYLSLGNVPEGSILYDVYPFVVWYVVIVVKMSVFGAQAAFLPRRFRWLRSMRAPRSTTLLVEGIPPERQCDAELLAFFGGMFGKGAVLEAFVVKDTTCLASMLAEKEAVGNSLQQACHKWERAGKDPARRPQHLQLTKIVDSIDYFTQRKEEIACSAKAERARILAESAVAGGVNSGTGFVTFTSRADATVALGMEYTADLDQWTVSLPPALDSIRWADLMQNENAGAARAVLGIGLIVAFFVAYLPTMVCINYLAKSVDAGPMDLLWSSLAPTAGLTVMVSVQPTIMICIFRRFFTLRDDAWAQHRLLRVLLISDMIFVILVTAVGTSAVGFLDEIVRNPLNVFDLLGNRLPHATHFYMNYITLQWAFKAFNLTRATTFMKFLVWRRLYGDEIAKGMSEPEDQDSDGPGCRSARSVCAALIGIIFSTCSPGISLLVFIQFVFTRLFSGYLLCHAETRKPDLGGVFWVDMLRFLLIGLGTYVVMMSGVLYHRSKSSWPSLLAASALAYVWWAQYRFETQFRWQSLPFAELRQADDDSPSKGGRAEAELAPAEQARPKYVQPELEETGEFREPGAAPE